ncbi:MAG: hypothetical protein C0524_07245 [Rhodobacter sp.]|nr:hypothetical protein [Rhodobacter sp.]
MKPPPNPYLVLVTAILLPGVGQWLNRQPVRGLIFVFFIILLGGFTLKTAAPDVSFVGKISGGLFVWAMAVFDAYKTAHLRMALWQHKRG